MRNDLINQLIHEARKNKNIFLLNGDLGYSVLEPFKKEFPKRYINVGISEQNMMGIAAGLALSGKKVFVYSIVNFLTFRCLEQIRNDVCYHNLDVNLISVGSGFSYGSQGYTHHGIEDISLMNSLPNMKIYTPSNINELIYLSKKIFKNKNPKYIRLPRKTSNFQSNKISGFYSIKKKSKINIISYGEIISECFKAVNLSKKKVGIFSWPNLFNRLDQKKVIEILKKSSVVVVVEEHIENGGLGLFLINIKNKYNLKLKIILANINKKNYGLIGDRNFLLKKNKIDSENIKKILLSC
jgi:transketolase